MALLAGAAFLAVASGWLRASDLGRVNPLVWLSSFAVLLLAGQLALALPLGLSAVTFPVLLVGACTFLALAIAGFVAHRSAPRPWHDAAAAIATGGCLVTTVAFTLEMLAGGVLVAALFALGYGDGLLRIAQEVSAAADLEALDADVLGLLLDPAVLTAAFLLFAVAGPLVEEALKLLAANGLSPRTEPDAWFNGVAVGAGFGLLEGVTLGAAIPAGWLGVMLVRAVSTLMHAAVGGLAAWSWFRLRRGRRGGATGVAAAFLAHMAWNGLVLGVVVATAQAGGEPSVVASGLALSEIALFTTLFLGYYGITGLMATRRQPASAGAVPEQAQAVQDDDNGGTFVPDDPQR
jgi:hypothetical protein